ncbi:MAG: hypothetical protein QM286_12980 [Acidobacteriota bacterium]|nr:hypothetical protein [Acidobacteriota bacterium]
MSSVGSLLVAADQEARAILLDGPDPGRAKSRLLSWAEVMEAALPTMAAILGDAATHSEDVGTLAYASQAAASIDREAHRNWPGNQPADERMARVCRLFGVAGSRLQGQQLSPRQVADLSVVVLHTGWLLTHAAAISLTRHAQELRRADPADAVAVTVTRLTDRVRSVEQLLDTRANGRRPHEGQPDYPGLAGALTAWTSALQTVLASQPDPRHFTIAADVNLTLMAGTASLATAASQVGTLPVRDVHDRLVPALANAAQAWAGTREAWGALVTPDTSGSRQLIQAAIGLRTTLRETRAAQAPETMSVLAAGLAASVEAAVLSRAGLIHLDRAPAATVTTLVESLVAQNPDQACQQFRVFQAMDSTEGRAPTAVPELLKEHLLRHADQTLTASIAARSAGNLLLPTSSHAATVTFAAAKADALATRPSPPTCEPSTRPTVGR